MYLHMLLRGPILSNLKNHDFKITYYDVALEKHIELQLNFKKKTVV